LTLALNQFTFSGYFKHDAAMKNNFPSPQKTIFIAFLFFVLSAGLIPGYAVNPDRSPTLINLSASVNPEPLDDSYPEMIIEGNTIHLTWLEYKYGTENWLYYRRSTDLGKTWEAAKQIIKLKSSDYMRYPQSRELAVDGNNVHIAVCDYDYPKNGTGSIFYIRSSNGGSSFDPVKELTNTGGGFNHIRHSYVKSAGGKVAIAFTGDGPKNGVRLLISSDNGNSFTEKPVTADGSELSDFWFDGTRLVILSQSAYFYYGLNWGKVYASVSNDAGGTFVTSKVSFVYKNASQNDVEKCLSMHDVHYSAKISVSGGVIHIVYSGENEKGASAVFYVRSTDNGQTFEKPVDVNNGLISNIQSFQESVLSIGDQVYIIYMSTGSKLFFAGSSDKGKAFMAARSILPDGFYHTEKTWWPSLVADPADVSGKSFYVTGNHLFSLKSRDGGETFGGSTVANLLLNSHTSHIMADMAIDNEGILHWIAEARYRGGTDKDIYYRKLARQPDPGTVNKSYFIETTWNEKAEALVVPSSQHINFDSAMTAEAWVKFDANSPDKVSILAKINGYDGDDWYLPPGYNMGFRRNQGKSCINSAIVTDKGEFINWGDCTIDDTLWHHIAFTYDANAGLNNYKTYVDGTLRVQTTVTGKLRQGDGLLLIGSRTAFYQNTKYQIDDVRLWNRALSQEELLFNQTAQLTGKEPGLKMFLNFNDTFKDISGNGNDAIPVYLGTLVKSDFNPPVPGFDSYKSENTISFNNKTTNANKFNWNFGDGSGSSEGNPKHVYPKPGEYPVFMTAKNTNSVTSVKGHVSITGLDRIEPKVIGNYGYSTIRVFGGGLTNKSTFKLRKGTIEILPDTIAFLGQELLSGTFDFTGKESGQWDVVVKTGTTEYVLTKALELVEAQRPKTWATLSGRGNAIFNMWQTYTITYGNDSNVDAYATPLYFAITDDENIEIEFIDFELRSSDPNIFTSLKNVGIEEARYFSTNEVLGENFKAKVYPFLIPVIRANSSSSIHIRIKSNVNFKIHVWSTPPWLNEFSVPTKSAFATQGNLEWSPMGCLLGSLVQLGVDAGAGLVGGFAGTLVYARNLLTMCLAHEARSYGDKQWLWASNVELLSVFTTGMVSAGLVLSYTVTWPWVLALTTAVNLPLAVARYHECLQTKDLNSSVGMLVNMLWSWDPNEMAGPVGFGDQNYILKSKTIPYTVYFENKKEATAPAHVVTIRDTLDLSVFDISEFGFGAFGWGDSIYSPPGSKLKEFSTDINMRPAMQLITRVSAKLDTITGIVKWEFLSLNPATMDIEEDPFIGFLPPNVSSPEGEGFVSFSVGLRKELKTNDALRNKASIVFDANAPIITNEYLNTIDMDLPASKVLALETTTKDYFTVNWSGADVGSGIKGYTIFVLQNDTLLYPWKTYTSETSAVFVGEVGSTYKFYSIATDNVSLQESDPGTYDAMTTVTVDVEEFELKKGDLQVYPNPAKERVTVSVSQCPLWCLCG
jgi:hypothetical protein